MRIYISSVFVDDQSNAHDFYTRVLGMRLETFGEPGKPSRKALRFGDQKFNLHRAGDKGITDIYAVAPTVGAIDLCLLAAVPLDELIAHAMDDDNDDDDTDVDDGHGTPPEIGRAHV